MKTTKHNLSAIAVGVALATASLSALAANPTAGNPAVPGASSIISSERVSTPPSFNAAEQTGLCLLESVASLLATRTNDFGCSGTYDLAVFTTDTDGVGKAEIDLGVDNGGTTLNAYLDPVRDIGTRCRVDEADGINKLKKVEVVNYDGDHGWSRTSEIFNSDAYIKLRDPQTGGYNKYREVDIKDYFKRVVAGSSWEFDWGLEDIKKFRRSNLDLSIVDRSAKKESGFYYPVQKWHEASWYRHENGQEGGLWLRKYQVIPRSAAGCQVRIEADDMFNGSGEFQMHGTVTVGKFPVAPFANRAPGQI